MRILAFDISASPGIAIIDIMDVGSPNPKPRLVAVDHIETDSSSTDAQRFEYVKAFATTFIHENGAEFDAIVREKFIKGGSKRSTQLVFGAWSAIDMALSTYNYSIDEKDEIVASSVKKLIGGKGGASKEEVAEGVIARLGEDTRPHFFTERGRLLDDRADAAAIALAYAIRKGLIGDD